MRSFKSNYSCGHSFKEGREDKWPPKSFLPIALVLHFSSGERGKSSSNASPKRWLNRQQKFTCALFWCGPYPLLPDLGEVRQLLFFPRYLASGSGDTTVRFWDLSTETPHFTCQGQYALSHWEGLSDRQMTHSALSFLRRPRAYSNSFTQLMTDSIFEPSQQFKQADWAKESVWGCGKGLTG